MIKDEHKAMLIDIARGAVELERQAWQDAVRQARQDQAAGSFGSRSVFGFTRAAEAFAPRFINAAATGIGDHATGLVPAPTGEELRSLLREVVTPLTEELLQPFMSATETNNRGMRETNLKGLQDVFATHIKAAEGRLSLRSEKVDQAQAILALAAALLVTRDPGGADAARNLSAELASPSPRKSQISEYLATLSTALGGIDKGFSVGKMLADLIGAG